MEQFVLKILFSSSGFPEWRPYTVRTFNKPLYKTTFSINTLLLCLSAFTTLSTHFSVTNIPTPSDLSLLPIQNSLCFLPWALKNPQPLPVHFVTWILPHPILYLPASPPVHPLFPSVSQCSRYWPEISSLSTVYQHSGHHEHLYLSTGLCCVLAGFPHLLFAWACGGANGVIPNNRTFANHLLLDFVVQGKITEADTPTFPLGAASSKLVSDRPPSSPWFLRRMPFLPQPSQFILAWDRHRNMLDCIPPWLGARCKWIEMTCIWSGWCHCRPIISCSGKILNGLPFWCQLTQVVLEKCR